MEVATLFVIYIISILIDDNNYFYFYFILFLRLYYNTNTIHTHYSVAIVTRVT